MFRIFARLITIIFVFSLALTSLTRLLAYNELYFQQIQAFFVSSDSCNTSSCFFGIGLGQADYFAITDALRESPYINAINVVDTHARLQYIDWEWSGAQPLFITETGFLRFRNDIATRITLTSDLTLGEIWLALGEPTAITENSVYLYFRYVERGFVIRTIPNCDDIWHSSVWIEFDEFINRPISRYLSLSEALNPLCERQ